MSRKNRVPVCDSSARKVLFYRSESVARKMVENRAAFILSKEPLEIALCSNNVRRKQIDIEGLRPDQSLTVPPSVIHGFAVGFEGPKKIVQSYKDNHSAKTVQDVPNKVKAPPEKEKKDIAYPLNRLAQSVIETPDKVKAPANWEVITREEFVEWISRIEGGQCDGK